MPKYSFLSILTLLLTAPLLAQSLTPDRSSPQAVLTAAYTALKAGDIQTAKSYLLFKNDQAAELFDITYSQLYGPLNLMHAMEAKFGPAARELFANAPLEKALDDLIEKIKAANLQTDAGKATIVDKPSATSPALAGELSGITFKKVGNEWKILAETFSEAAAGDSDIPATQLKVLQTLRDTALAAVNATAARLAKGDFKTADEAYADYQTRVQSGLQTALTPGSATVPTATAPTMQK